MHFGLLIMYRHTSSEEGSQGQGKRNNGNNVQRELGYCGFGTTKSGAHCPCRHKPRDFWLNKVSFVTACSLAHTSVILTLVRHYEQLALGTILLGNRCVHIIEGRTCSLEKRHKRRKTGPPGVQLRLDSRFSTDLGPFETLGCHRQL